MIFLHSKLYHITPSWVKMTIIFLLEDNSGTAAELLLGGITNHLGDPGEEGVKKMIFS